MSVEKFIHKHLGKNIKSVHPIGSGLFSANKVVLEDQSTVFIKTQQTPNQSLIQEAYELNLLRKSVNTPNVLGSCEYSLILQWIESGHNPYAQSQLGTQLANLHKTQSEYFGFDFDNKIGTTPQINAVGKKIESWAEFYWQYRLKYQIDLAMKNHHLNQDDYEKLLKIKTVLPSLLTDNIRPSLLHGDLWSGNYISSENQTYFIDTASYYGHREADLALTFMFGGFSNEFYQSYEKAYPLDAGFEKRKPLYMLYHYLNHLNLFGSGYYSGVMGCAKQLV